MSSWGKTGLLGLCWLAGLWWTGRSGFVLVYLTVTGICMIFLNLGERKGASAYSVFNKKCRSILGTLDGKALEAQFTHRDPVEEAPDSPLPKVTPDNRLRNKPCPCGSGIKHKKCCMLQKDSPDDYWSENKT